ncbi:MAG: hypothetical protein RKO66_00955 [Candidatus Contendobacter sp.]|nr:hypothetical protein [Candidatus Contendobacter sp.]MDS4057176.1 hypothetical protein [Candidatus Contendobacter sp.]
MKSPSLAGSIKTIEEPFLTYIVAFSVILALNSCSVAPNFDIQPGSGKTALQYSRDKTICLKLANDRTRNYQTRDFSTVHENIYAKCMAAQGNYVAHKGSDLSDQSVYPIVASPSVESPSKIEAAETSRKQEISAREAVETSRKQEIFAREAAETSRKHEAAILAKYAPLLDRIIRDDSKSWSINKYDRGSVKEPSIVSISSDESEVVIKGNYTYNHGQKGWVEAHFSNGQLSCLRFWDINACRPQNNFVKRSLSPKESLNLLSKCYGKELPSPHPNESKEVKQCRAYMEAYRGCGVLFGLDFFLGGQKMTPKMVSECIRKGYNGP